MIQTLLALVDYMIYIFTQTAVNEQSYSRQYAIVLLLLCLVFLMKGFIPSKLINSFLKIIYTSALFPVKLKFHITNFRVILEKKEKKKNKPCIRYAASFIMTSDVELLIMMNFMG